MRNKSFTPTLDRNGNKCDCLQRMSVRNSEPALDSDSRRYAMLYAAYGSNLHPGRLRKRVPSADLVGCAKIEGWSLNFNKRGKDGSGKCSIGVSRNSFVYVAVYDMDPGRHINPP